MQKRICKSMMIINASSMHTTENRDYIRIDEQIIRIDEEIIRKRERNRRRNIHTWPDVHWDYTKYPYTLKVEQT